ncbi:MAG: MiaB/RimO family radical SAM methylthiotransferase [Eggerthellaceae bacterium]|nr:MiaB/RimO family radical SAM methylthiotransferase [Eggerthellaceae bacterium]
MAETRKTITAESLGIEPGLRFCVINHGCKVNKVEADTASSYLAALGAELVDEEDAQLVIVNTCTVTGEADKKARKAVRHALKIAPEALVIVTGCGAAIDACGYAGIDERVRVIERFELLEALKPKNRSPLRIGKDFRTRVNIKIQDGCDHACTYCIVHVARGKARSVDASQVLDEAERYFANGAKELVLAGIDLGSYRSGDIGLANLVESLVERAKGHCSPGDIPARVRASSLEPMTIDDAFIDLLARSEGSVCRHLHVPLQSGSTKVLREMARPYTSERFLSLVERLYERVPSLSLTTDIIVGFPGETDDDFACTLELARACRFSKIHVFPYSKRAGTPAAKRLDQVDPIVVRQRASELRRLSDELRERDYRSRIGTSELVLVESRCALTESYHEIPLPEGAEDGSLLPVVLG